MLYQVTPFNPHKPCVAEFINDPTDEVIEIQG